MEESKLTHMMPNLNSRKSTSQSPPPNSASLFLEQNNKHTMNNAQACKSPSTIDNGDKGKANNGDENDKVEEEARVEETGREKLKRHREEVMGHVKIPENWGQEKLLKEWMDYTTFDALFAPQRLIVTARDALIADARRARSQRLRIQSSF